MEKQANQERWAPGVRELMMAALCATALTLGPGMAGAAESNAPQTLPQTEGEAVQETLADDASGMMAEDGDVDADATEEAGKAEYEYQVVARPDPFKPFIAPKTVNPNELVDENQELTGMQLFEPGQLNLVAVMDTPQGRMAMVEDVTKKGYKITMGQLIGRRGQVTEIRKDEVLVTETAHTRGGEEIKTVVSMKMKRDGEGK